MKGAIYDQFQQPLSVNDLPDPKCGPSDVVIQVKATGICRSDWHGWMGHDGDIKLPHVPGHELAGIIVEKGENITGWEEGDRVTLPFCLGCGTCQTCKNGHTHICDRYEQPGFTVWGSFAEYVRVPYAQYNLYQLPEEWSFKDAAVLGCRYLTAFRAVTDIAKITEGDHVAVFGCGGVGLSAIQLSKALGAIVFAIDVKDQALQKAKDVGADFLFNSKENKDFIEEIKHLTHTGVAVTIDALGHPTIIHQSLHLLSKRGRHIQIGLLLGDHLNPSVAIDLVIAKELEILGSHGMPAAHFPKLFDFISRHHIDVSRLIQDVVDLESGINVLMDMGRNQQQGVTIISFS